MTLERFDCGKLRLSECPVCGVEIESKPGASGGPAEHLESHSPEDFGLSPIGSSSREGPA